MRKLGFKTLFQKNSSADCILVFKVRDIVRLSAFVWELEIVWNPVCLLWIICDLCHAEWARLQVGGCLKVVLAGWESPTKGRITDTEGRKLPWILSCPCLYLSAAEECVPASEEPSAPLHSAPLPSAVQGTHSHHSCTLQALCPGQNVSLSVRDGDLKTLTEEVLNQMCPFPERMSYLKK